MDKQPLNKTLDGLLRARGAVQQALDQSRAARAWELLQERDADGHAKGPQPYTDQALAELEAAHREDPDDPELVHHLAIAHHARAWDLELAGDAGAEQQWECALGHWRRLGSTAEFWEKLKTKLLQCDPRADVSQIDQFRRELLERLLEVHVAFIVHYWEINRADLATRHVTIIGRSRIPPAVKKRLVGKVFDEVTARFRQVGDQQAADAVLAMTERFLRLFPDHLPALRQYTEAATRCVEQMSSYQRDWQQIVQFADRTTPSLRALSQHPELASDPLAVDVLVRLATELTLRGRDRSDSLLGDDFHAVAHSKRCEAKGALTSAIEWGRLAAPHALPDSVLLRLLANVLNSKALCTFVDCQDALDSDRSDRVRLEEARNLIHGAVSLSQEALALAPDDDTLAKNLEFLLENREKLDEP